MTKKEVQACIQTKPCRHLARFRTPRLPRPKTFHTIGLTIGWHAGVIEGMLKEVLRRLPENEP